MDKMSELFIEKFEKKKDTYVKIVVSQHKIKILKNFVEDVINEKRKERHHKIDNFHEYKRFYTGTLGELAIEEYLGISFVDFSIGDSSFYNKADLNKLRVNIGVKTVEYGKFPIVSKNPVRPEIINVKYNNNTVYICGIATINTLLAYQNDDLILSSKLRARNVKTGFEGINSLIPIDRYYDIKKLRVVENIR